jgi:hypothetical protein
LGVGGNMPAYPMQPLGHPFLHLHPFNHPPLAVMDYHHMALEGRVLLPRDEIIQRTMAYGELQRMFPRAQEDSSSARIVGCL